MTKRQPTNEIIKLQRKIMSIHDDLVHLSADLWELSGMVNELLLDTDEEIVRQEVETIEAEIEQELADSPVAVVHDEPKTKRGRPRKEAKVEVPDTLPPLPPLPPDVAEVVSAPESISSPEEKPKRRGLFSKKSKAPQDDGELRIEQLRKELDELYSKK